MNIAQNTQIVLSLSNYHDKSIHFRFSETF